MTTPLIEVFRPELVGDEYRAAAQINTADGPIRLVASAPEPMIARWLARLQALVAVHHLGELRARAGAVGADLSSAAGIAAAGELLAAAERGSGRANARLRTIYELAAKGEPRAVRAAMWVRAAKDRGGVGAALTDRDRERLARLQIFQAWRRGARLRRVSQ